MDKEVENYVKDRMSPSMPIHLFLPTFVTWRSRV